MPRITTKDGTTLYYRDWGAGRPVVFVHSMLMTGDAWQYQMLHLADRGFRTVAPDRRGHGQSDDPGTGYDFDTLADDLAAVLETLDLTDVMLVGHSMGGGEIVRYLSRHGTGRVGRIALVGSTVPRLDVDADARAALLNRLRTDYGGWVAENAAASFGTEPPGHEIAPIDKELTIRSWLSVSLRAVVECMSVNTVADFRPELRRITSPTLIVHGDDDAFAPLDMCGRRAVELIPDSTLTIYPGASHMLQLTHRQQLSNDLLAFAQREH